MKKILGIGIATLDIINTVDSYPHEDDEVRAINQRICRGAYALDKAGENHHSPAFPPTKLIDTLGAGDTFNAGIIDAYIQNRTLPDALEQACKLAGKKCGQYGLSDLLNSAIS